MSNLVASDNTGRYGRTKFKNLHGTGVQGTSPYAFGDGMFPAFKAGETYSTVSTAADTNETDLHSYTLLANLLNRDGAELNFEFIGTYGATANNKTLKLYWGGTQVYTSGTVAGNATNWHLKMKVVRTAASAQRIFISGMVNNTNVTSVYTTATKDETTALVAKVTGTNGTAAAADINCTLSRYDYSV